MRPIEHEGWRRLRSTAEALSDPFPYRRYMRRHKVIFIHVPRCAGTSILKTLAGRTRPRDHCAFQVYRQADPARFSSYFKFAFVREPIARLESVYRYLKNGGNGEADLLLSESIDRASSNFDEFVQNWLDEKHLMTVSLFRPQTFYLYDGVRNEIALDFIGRFEEFERDSRVVSQRLGLPDKSPPVVNESPATPGPKLEIEDGTRKRLRELYALDFEILGYD